MCAFVRACLHVCERECVDSSEHACLHACLNMSVWLHACVFANVCAFECACKHVCERMSVLESIHAYKQTSILVCVCVCICTDLQWYIPSSLLFGGTQHMGLS